ncbi:MAG: hypothetical protein NDJ89_16055 [Oligoflexia bacterium]|nr:hypothetical protein [Oligoflexia bacterium]
MKLIQLMVFLAAVSAGATAQAAELSFVCKSRQTGLVYRGEVSDRQEDSARYGEIMIERKGEELWYGDGYSVQVTSRRHVTRYFFRFHEDQQLDLMLWEQDGRIRGRFYLEGASELNGTDLVCRKARR